MTIARGPRLDSANALIANFARLPKEALGRGKGKQPDPQQSPVGWPVSRDVLVQQLRRRLAGHDLPRQVGTSYCGPAAFLYCLLEDRPDVYVAYAISMWLRGAFDFRSPLASMDITSSASVRVALEKARQANTKHVRLISDLDWMTMAPLSMSTRPFNGVFGTPSLDDTVGSISYPPIVKQWFAAAGARLREDTMGLGAFKSPTGRTIKLLAAWPNSWIVLQIDSSLLRGGGNTTNTFENRHWVVVNPHRPPLVYVGSTGRVVLISDVLKSAAPDDPHPDMSNWQTSVFFASWGDENTPLQGQHLGQFTGRIYGGFAFSHFR